MQLPLYQLDAFTREPFKGNPAAVVPLDAWLADDVMQAIAAENNLAETAFYVREASGYRIRWFTPTVEVTLCGHATLASAAVMTMRGEFQDSKITFASLSGELAVSRDGEKYVLDFPAQHPQEGEEPAGLVAALGAKPHTILLGRFTLCVFEDEKQVRALQPEMAALAKAEREGVIATAPGSDCDFVCRMFAPAMGIPEDPVTGSAYTILAPYWSKRLSKSAMFARQISKRGGEIWCEEKGSRVHIGGYVAPYLEGTITI
jgi:PhzF family phenazine biosynthesis protein